MARVCLYHGSDLDGICSAAIVKSRWPDTTLYPLEYNQHIDLSDRICEGDDVVLVDFTIQPFEKMVELNKMVNLVWIDHHDTTIADHERFVKSNKTKPIKGNRDNSLAACELTWKFCYPNRSTPYSVYLIGRYDVWDHKATDSVEPFEYGMKLSYEDPSDLVFWNRIFNSARDSDIIQDIIRDGRTIIKYRTKLNKKICEMQMFESEIVGYRCICINRSLCGSSVFDSVWNPEEHDIMAVFYICARGAWNVSLYTTKHGIHVGNIAKLYGGGGHAGAAGFKCSLLPFEVIK